MTRARLGLLWKLVGDTAGVSRREFNRYFHGLDEGVAIQIDEVRAFPNPVPLEVLRAAWKGFNPPQGFRYVDLADVANLSGHCERRAA